MRRFRFALRHGLSAAALLAASIAAPLGVGAALAQAPPAATASTSGAVKPRAHLTLKERFAEANTSSDGHMTLDQARAGMPMVARHFAEMDKDSKGYVTLTDVQIYLKEQRAMRHKPAPSTG